LSQDAGIRAAVNERRTPARRLDKNGVTFSDIEEGDGQHSAMIRIDRGAPNTSRNDGEHDYRDPNDSCARAHVFILTP
jgi:hypothetical protein